MNKTLMESRLGNKLHCYFQRNISVFRFATVGCMNTAVDFAVFTLLKSVFNFNYLICQTAAYIAAIINSFILNKMWTFENQDSPVGTHIQFAMFFTISSISLGISLLGLKILVGHWDMNVYIAKVLVTILTQAVNYLGYRFWVFPEKARLETI